MPFIRVQQGGAIGRVSVLDATEAVERQATRKTFPWLGQPFLLTLRVCCETAHIHTYIWQRNALGRRTGSSNARDICGWAVRCLFSEGSSVVWSATIIIPDLHMIAMSTTTFEYVYTQTYPHAAAAAATATLL